jgi:hypothetical protein
VCHILSIQGNVNEYTLGIPGNPGSFKISYDEKEATFEFVKSLGSQTEWARVFPL